MRGYTKWSKEKIIEKIKELEKREVDLSAGHISKNFIALFTAATRYFGSWGEAVKAAGIDYESIKAASYAALREKLGKWSPEKVVKEIKKIPKKELRFVYRTHFALQCAARREFGSWENALRAAGYDYLRLNGLTAPAYTHWTEERIINKIKELYASREAPDKGLNVFARYPSLYSAACRIFGSWRKSLEEAGFDESFIKLHTRRRKWRRKWPKEKIIKTILELHGKGENLRAVDVQKKLTALFSAAIREFKRWKKAIAAAGLDYQEIKKSAKAA